MAKVTIGDKQVQVIQHNVDLSTSNQSKQLIRSCFIDITKKTRFFGILGQDPDDSYRLCVIPTADKDLIIKNIDNLLVLRYGEQVSSSVDVKADSNRIDFQLYLDPDQIIDCTKVESSEDDQFKICYTIQLFNDSREQVTAMDGALTVKLQRVKMDKPVFEFVPNEKGASLTYSIYDTKPYQIGELKIRNAGKFLRCPACDMSFDIYATTADEKSRSVEIHDLISLGKTAKQSNPRVFMDRNEAGFVPENRDASPFRAVIQPDNARLTKLDVNKESYSSPDNNNVVTIPVFWDMSQVLNPTEDEKKYSIVIHGSYEYACGNKDIPLHNDQLSIILHRNKQIMELEVSLSDNERREVLESGKMSSIRKPLLVSGATTAYKLELKNTAEFTEEGKETARIYIKSFNATFPKSGKTTFTERKGRVNDATYTLLSDSIPLSVNQMSIPIGKSKAFSVEYDHTCIDKIYSDEGKEIYERPAKINISFMYFVDKEAMYDSCDEVPADLWLTYTTAIRILMQKEPKPEWLCLDYGTSAVVASFGDHRYDSHGVEVNRLIPLRETKQKNIKVWYQGNKDMLVDNTESSQFLINSATVVNNEMMRIGDKYIDKALESHNQYLNSPIWFSPTSGMLEIYSWILPSLKTFMGNRYLPAELVPNQVAVEGEVTVNKLFELVYKQLFTHFIPDEVKGTNKLVITIPNTYAPSHVEILRKLALGSLPELRPDYLRFMSESDAVAFYYLAKKFEFLKNSDLDLDADEFDKNVLVYDMGAGTLDLTYFTQEKQGDKTIISIEGKMGVSRAGNYLDYLLAEILAEIVAPKIEDEELRKQFVSLLSLSTYENRDSDAASAFKTFVRDVLKPSLNENDDYALPVMTLFDDELPTDQCTIGDIVNHDKFKAYLVEISDNVFNHFASLFSNELHQVEPSLVIFSGRTTSIKKVRMAVAEALRQQNMVTGECVFLDLAAGQFSQNAILDEDRQSISNLKTAVVDGALSFCSDFAAGNGDFILRNKNVYAQYGIMFKIGQRWVWEPLIDVNTEPVNKDEAVLSPDGMTVYQYDSSVHSASSGSSSVGTSTARRRHKDFSSISLAYVLQSYSDDTLGDWEAENKDLISVIGWAILDNVKGDRDYKIVIDEKNQLHFYIGPGQIPLLAHDEYDTDSFRKSMWPIVR